MFNYILSVLLYIEIFTVWAISLYFTAGPLRIVNIGQAGIIGIGAYTSSILSIFWGVPVLISIFIASVVSTLVGLFLGIIYTRLPKKFISLATFIAGMIIYHVLENFNLYTLKSTGIPDIPALPNILSSKLLNDFAFMTIIVIIMGILILKIHNSLIHKILIATGDDDYLLLTSGISPVKVTVFAFSLGSFIGGAGGAIYAHIYNFVSPDIFDFILSFNLLLTVLLGGNFSIIGTVEASILIVILGEAIRTFNIFPESAMAPIKMILFSVSLLLLILYRAYWRKTGER